MARERWERECLHQNQLTRGHLLSWRQMRRHLALLTVTVLPTSGKWTQCRTRQMFANNEQMFFYNNQLTDCSHTCRCIESTDETIPSRTFHFIYMRWQVCHFRLTHIVRFRFLGSAPWNVELWLDPFIHITCCNHQLQYNKREYLNKRVNCIEDQHNV